LAGEAVLNEFLNDCIPANMVSREARITEPSANWASTVADCKTVWIRENGIQIEKDQSKRNYLQLRDDSFGSVLKAGLFKD